MRTNGTISFLLSSGGGTGAYGEPLASEPEWGSPVPCHVHTVSRDETRKGVDGVFRQLSFTVMVEPAEGVTGAARVRLTRRGEALGDFDVVSAERVETQGRLEITV